MFKPLTAFSGFSVDNLDKAKEFYTTVLGLELASEEMGLRLQLPGGGAVFVYQKDDHAPASFTILNFVVEDIDTAVKQLGKKGISFESYDFGNGAKTDESGVMRGRAAQMGPDIAWFKDPAGNVLSVMQD